MAIQLSRKSKNFVDISLAFESSPVTGDITVLRDERAINNSIKNLIMIMPTEVPFESDVGSTVRNLLFDVIDEGTGGLIALEVERTIKYNEPRAEILNVVADPQPDQNNFMLTVAYKIVGYDQVFTVSTILEPTR
jgi:phage baseplate assembly protein W